MRETGKTFRKVLKAVGYASEGEQILFVSNIANNDIFIKG